MMVPPHLGERLVCDCSSAVYKGELYSESASYHVCTRLYIGLTSFLSNKNAPSLEIVPMTPQCHCRQIRLFSIRFCSDHKLDDRKL